MDTLDDREKTWTLKVKGKCMLFGRQGPRIPVGNRPDELAGCEDDDEDELVTVCNRAKNRGKDMEEPFLFHTVPSALLEELCHSVDAVAVIALAGDGKAAMAALKRKVPFFGPAFTQEHISSQPLVPERPGAAPHFRFHSVDKLAAGTGAGNREADVQTEA